LLLEGGEVGRRVLKLVRVLEVGTAVLGILAIEPEVATAPAWCLPGASDLSSLTFVAANVFSCCAPHSHTRLSYHAIEI
jgi:hypothetical protein